MLELINNDLFNIERRLKSINPKYVIFRNKVTGKVEVHSNSRPCAQSLEFVVPYTELDERTLDYARKTRIENFDAIEQELIKTNADIRQSARKSVEQSASVLGDMMSYAGSQVHNIVFEKNKRWF